MKLRVKEAVQVRYYAENLKAFLQSRGLTLRGAAIKLGISAPYLSDIGKQRRYLSSEMKKRIEAL